MARSAFSEMVQDKDKGRIKRNHKAFVATFELQVAVPETFAKSYSQLMVSTCALYGMKPVCSHVNFCENDPKAVYIKHWGYLTSDKDRPLQQKYGHLKYFDTIKDKWKGLCAYTGAARENFALCNDPEDKNKNANDCQGGCEWQEPSKTKPRSFMCGRKRELPSDRRCSRSFLESLSFLPIAVLLLLFPSSCFVFPACSLGPPD